MVFPMSTCAKNTKSESVVRVLLVTILNIYFVHCFYDDDYYYYYYFASYIKKKKISKNQKGNLSMLRPYRMQAKVLFDFLRGNSRFKQSLDQ